MPQQASESVPQEAEQVSENFSLLAREIRPMRNWFEWLGRWKQAETLEEMISLLHVGFGVSMNRYYNIDERGYDEIDRILAYLKVADYWNSGYDLRAEGDGEEEYMVGYDKNGNRQRERRSGLRRMVAHKAFDMLCVNFFRIEEADEGRRNRRQVDGPERLFDSAKLLNRVMYFFRSVEVRPGYWKFPNLPDRDSKSHNEMQVVNFFVALTKVAWQWKEEEVQSWLNAADKERIGQSNAEKRGLINQAKPWLVKVLSCLRKLDVLEPWILEFDAVTLAVLEKLAMANELLDYRHPVSKTRPVASIDEACYVGSPAALLLRQHKLLKGVDDQLRELRVAEQKKDEADREIERLKRKG